jgi:hypothetical protein
MTQRIRATCLRDALIYRVGKQSFMDLLSATGKKSEMLIVLNEREEWYEALIETKIATTKQYLMPRSILPTTYSLGQ